MIAVFIGIGVFIVYCVAVGWLEFRDATWLDRYQRHTAREKRREMHAIRREILSKLIRRLS